MMSPLKILICGSAGRMGRMVAACVESDPETEIAGGVDVGDDIGAALPGADVVIEFSLAEATPGLVAAAAEARKAIVVGTTGHNEDQREVILDASAKVPVVFAPNYSVGVNTLFWLTRKAVDILGPEVDLEVVEMHHRHKKDAPSGTAKRLAEILAEGRGLSYETDVRHGRHGIVGERPRDEIGMHALRGGDVVGDHKVIFALDSERVELGHRASGREIFARGAVRAAKWVFGRPSGLYDMQDVLGLK